MKKSTKACNTNGAAPDIAVNVGRSSIARLSIGDRSSAAAATNAYRSSAAAALSCGRSTPAAGVNGGRSPIAASATVDRFPTAVAATAGRCAIGCNRPGRKPLSARQEAAQSRSPILLRICLNQI